MTINGSRARLLRAALAKLRVWESQSIDLFWDPTGTGADTRAATEDREMPQEYIAERERLMREVVRLAALVGGAPPDEAEMYADDPRASLNPYNVQRARVAASLVWRLGR